MPLMALNGRWRMHLTRRQCARTNSCDFPVDNQGSHILHWFQSGDDEGNEYHVWRTRWRYTYVVSSISSRLGGGGSLRNVTCLRNTWQNAMQIGMLDLLCVLPHKEVEEYGIPYLRSILEKELSGTTFWGSGCPSCGGRISCRWRDQRALSLMLRIVQTMV